MDKNNYLPIGTIVKVNEKLCMIVGYSAEDGDYGVICYPFSDAYSDVRGLPFNEWKDLVGKFDWYYTSRWWIRSKDISEVVFLGYRDESYQEMVCNFNKDEVNSKFSIYEFLGKLFLLLLVLYFIYVIVNNLMIMY